MTRSAQKGFTLLEVLLALVIFAGASLALISSLNGQMQASSQIQELTMGGWVADNYLAEQQLNPVSEDGSTKGKTEMAGRSWSWESKVSHRDELAVETITITLENGQKKTLERLSPAQTEIEK
ncbi:type II secretion system minor pseudopilin GspI [Dryocola sp. BD626]|uniref:type II secretion system minor pseudopilin GspI n=1 Tax=Dryocola sp. BD626 TaxID=3133273 RepID=UPI003F4F92B1